MSDFKIFIDDQSLRVKQPIKDGKNALVGFHILIRQQPFPGEHFLDFPVVVLGWWLDGYMKLVQGDKCVENLFMNGPFGFDSSLQRNQVVLRFWQRRQNGNVEIQTSLTLPQLGYKSELIQAGEKLVDILHQISANTRDVDYLETMLKSVKNYPAI